MSETGNSLNLNLLPSQAKFQADKLELQKKIKRYMLWAGIAWVAVILISLGINLVSNMVLAVENKNYQKSLNNLKSMNEEVTLSQLVKYRIKTLGEVLGDRFEYSTAFDRVSRLFSPQTQISGMKLNQDRSFRLKLTTDKKEGLDYIETQIQKVAKGEIEGISEVKVKTSDFDREVNMWTVEVEVRLK